MRDVYTCELDALVEDEKCVLMKSSKRSVQWIQLCHGGIEPEYARILNEFLESDDEWMQLDGKHEGLMWSDFSGIKKWWGKNEDRGAGIVAGPDASISYCATLNLAGICRGHQDMTDSFKVMIRNVKHVTGWKSGESAWKLKRETCDPASDCGKCTLVTAKFQEQAESETALSKMLKHQNIPVYTFSSARMSRDLPSEGYGILTCNEGVWSLATRICTGLAVTSQTMRTPQTLVGWCKSWTACSPSEDSIVSTLENAVQKVKIDSSRQAPYVRKLFINPGSRVFMIGDLHGCMHALCGNLLRMRDDGAIHNNFKMDEKCYLIFLGDLVDRGEYGIEVCATIAHLLATNPTRVFLCRGNHESETNGRMYCDCTNESCLSQQLKGQTRKHAHVLELLGKLFRSLPDAMFVTEKQA